jgi:hypothetical protein
MLIEQSESTATARTNAAMMTWVIQLKSRMTEEKERTRMPPAYNAISRNNSYKATHQLPSHMCTSVYVGWGLAYLPAGIGRRSI